MTAMIPFVDWKPDISAYQGAASQTIQNVVPRGDGYGPFANFTAFTSALPAACRGFFYARKTDGSIATFAGTSTRLYLLSNTDFTWSDVSAGGSAYPSLPSSNHWQFAQFGNFIIAVQPNVVPQVYDLTSSTAFGTLGGAPPQAAYISVVGRFVVLSGLLSTPYRIQWSGLNATTTWTSGVNSSDFQDFPDGGIVRGVAGGEYGVVFQETAMRRMTYVPGSPVIFNIERLTEDKGMMAPYSLIRAAEKIFFLAPQGFHGMGSTGSPLSIGKERFDRTFFADVDSGSVQMIIGAADPAATRVYWAYKSNSGTTGQFDKVLCYDYALDRAAIVSMSGEYLASLAKPGLTLESLDAIASGSIAVTGAANNGSGLIRLTVATLALPSWAAPPDGASVPTQLATGMKVSVLNVGGTTEANAESWTITVVDSTHIDLQGSTFANAYTSGGIIAGPLDAMTISLDDFSTNALSQLSAVNTSHKLGFFAGANLEATLDTAEQALTPASAGAGGRRARVKGFRPITDAATCYGSVGARENVQSAVGYSAEQAVNAKGLCPANVSTRLARGRLRIPAGTSWTFASGVEPEFAPEGKR